MNENGVPESSENGDIMSITDWRQSNLRSLQSLPCTGPPPGQIYGDSYSSYGTPCVWAACRSKFDSLSLYYCTRIVVVCFSSAQGYRGRDVVLTMSKWNLGIGIFRWLLSEMPYHTFVYYLFKKFRFKPFLLQGSMSFTTTCFLLFLHLLWSPFISF